MKNLFILCLLLTFVTSAQVDRETRAVWVTTNFRLDWPPPTFDQEKQKQYLIDIFDDIKSKNLNTVFFQVRTNGVVFFKSSFEPLTQYITGEVDGDASYDPLEFAIEQAHKRGLEIHAWINVVRCFTGNESIILDNPNHISKRKPEWVISDTRDGQKSLWLDPGLPEVREYISNLIVEMTENYNIDGVHLDFIRYPGRNFDDDFSYSIYGSGYTRDNWRRNNITELISLINKNIKRVKPQIKFGAAPIGIYKNLKGMTGWEGYSEIYQDSREWLKRGILDYVAPQIYWGFDEKTRFDLLAKDWVQNSYGRAVFLGIAAYKENVKSQMESMINFSRTINADGVAFFRYENIKNFNFTSFEHKTYPSAMAWMDKLYPDAPSNLKSENMPGKKNYFNLSWSNQNKNADSASYFALYNLPFHDSEILPEYLFEIIPSDKNLISIAIEKPKKVNYYFTLKSVSQLWNESIESSNVISVNIPELSVMLAGNDFIINPILVKEPMRNSKLMMYASQKEKIVLQGIINNRIDELMNMELLPGKNILTIPRDISEYQLIKIVNKTSGKEHQLKL
jgi:uncharacterized lipoprotein YddW (UPF0748 family)